MSGAFFSRGSANLYALVAFDAKLPNPLFRAVIANSGGMSADFPANREIDSGRLGAAPYAGTRWWLYCGGGDPNPDRDGCPAMRRTRDWLSQRGADSEQRDEAAAAVQFRKTLSLREDFLPARHALLDAATKKGAWGGVASASRGRDRLASL